MFQTKLQTMNSGTVQAQTHRQNRRIRGLNPMEDAPDSAKNHATKTFELDFACPTNPECSVGTPYIYTTTGFGLIPFLGVYTKMDGVYNFLV